MKLVAWIGFPVLFPIIGSYIAFDTWLRQLGWKNGARTGGWWLRVWWVYGYAFAYKIDWYMKGRAQT
jgi:hypothetical protein